MDNYHRWKDSRKKNATPPPKKNKKNKKKTTKKANSKEICFVSISILTLFHGGLLGWNVMYRRLGNSSWNDYPLLHLAYLSRRCLIRVWQQKCSSWLTLHCVLFDHSLKPSTKARLTFRVKQFPWNMEWIVRLRVARWNETIAFVNHARKLNVWCGYTHTRTHTHTHVRVYKHTHTQTYAHAHACVHTHSHTSTRTHACTYTHTCSHTYTQTCTHTQTCIRVETCIRVHVHKRTHIRARVRGRAHAHTHNRPPPLSVGLSAYASAVSYKPDTTFHSRIYRSSCPRSQSWLSFSLFFFFSKDRDSLPGKQTGGTSVLNRKECHTLWMADQRSVAVEIVVGLSGHCGRRLFRYYRFSFHTDCPNKIGNLSAILCFCFVCFLCVFLPIVYTNMCKG